MPSPVKAKSPLANVPEVFSSPAGFATDDQ